MKMNSSKIIWLLALVFMINSAESDDCNPGATSPVGKNFS